ncbi:S41 family peptidase [Myxococcota bacterium]|nr:S41 family peptidase [Myxococcota bacterium]MBU1430396.1 S41 family peptidase [Myxococcota bacterium]MBU1897364.1 S41 family peptidase [Myxococcota bacterium]
MLVALPLLATLLAPDEALIALERLLEVYGRVQESYVEAVTPDALMDAAVKGMVKQLDPYSEVLDPRGVARFYEDTRGAFSGVGLEIALERGRAWVITPLEGSPAAAAGIQPRDEILAVDGISLQALNSAEIIERLRGPEGSQVRLRLRRGGQIFHQALRREAISIQAVEGVALGDHAFLLRVRVFQEGIASAARARLYAMGAFEDEGSRLILDLRGNPGGLVSEGVALADLFLEGGVIVEMKGRGEGMDRSWVAHAAGTLPPRPLVVLIDGGSASAAEIVAGALRDHRRAQLIGQASFGKGSVQRLLPLKGGYGLKLTVARYYTPSGVDLHERGIEPDILTPPPAQKIRPKLDEIPARLQSGALDDPALLRALRGPRGGER